MRLVLAFTLGLAALGCARNEPPSRPLAQPSLRAEYTLPETITLAPLKVAAFEDELKTKYAGHVVAVDVWFLGCAPCKKKMPGMVALAREYAPKGAVVMTVDQMPDDLTQKEDVVKFLESIEAKMPHYIFDDTEEAVDEWKSRAQFVPTPAVVFYDKNGAFVKTLIDATAEDVAKELDRLLAS